MIGSSAKLAMEIFITANDAVSKLNYIYILPLAFNMVCDLGGTV